MVCLLFIAWYLSASVKYPIVTDLDTLQKLAASHHDQHRCRYHWQPGADGVVVTIGDSWTHGLGLGDRHDVDHYGRLISASLDHAWINFGCKGGSNSWCLNILEQIIGFLNQSQHRQGVVIVTLTENGRDVNEGRSRPFDYSIYRDLAFDVTLFDRVLDDVEQEWIQRLQQSRALLDPRFSIVIGMNFCWHQLLFQDIGQIPGIQCLPRTWIECLPGEHVVPRIRTTNLTWPDTLLKYLGYKDTTACKQYILDTEPEILRLFHNLRDRHSYFPQDDPGHPNASAHRIWADALLAVI
jgi:lysophospholipase L1-like esterase